MPDLEKLIQQISILKSNQHYRVGDIINRHGLERSENSRVHILHNKEFKGSILNIYLNKISTPSFKNIPLAATKTCNQFEEFTGKFIDHSKERDYKLLADIVKKQSNQYLLPVATELCINLRGGDVLALEPREQHALKGKADLYLLPKNQETHTLIDLIKEKLVQYPSIKSITFNTAMHFGDHPWSQDFKVSNKKIEINHQLYRRLFSSVMSQFPSLKIKLLDLSSYRIHQKIDQDIIYLCNARHLIADTGGFSRQIKLIRNEFI